MTSSEISSGAHVTSLGLMSCVRESSPQECLMSASDDNQSKTEAPKKRRFHPLRGLRKIFRKKNRYSNEEENVQETIVVQESETQTRDTYKSRSVSELLSEDESPSTSVSNIYPGLSISHDSVFTGDKYPSTSNLDSEITQSSSSLSIQQHTHIKLELQSALRRRRDKKETTDEEDLGFPSSICDSPTAAHQTSHKTKSHSTCSDGSLLSIGSSEIDEVSFHHASYEERSVIRELKNEFGLDMVHMPLNHNAAKHKMAIKPKRTHGAPRRLKRSQLAVPMTIEEDSLNINFTSAPNILEETSVTDYPSNKPSAKDKNLKSASLPPGLTLPGKNILSRSSSAASSKQDKSSQENPKDKDKKEHKEEKEKKKEESFFGRFLIRRSGKKLSKKSKTEDQTISIFKSENDKETNFSDKQCFKTSISVDHIQDKKREMIKKEEEISNVQITSSKLHNLTITLDTAEEPQNNKSEEHISLTDQEIELQKSVERQKELFEKHKASLEQKMEHDNVKEVSKTFIEAETKNNNQYLFSDKPNIINDEKNKVSRHVKKMKSDDYFIIKSTNITIGNDERKRSVDSALKILDQPRSGPASRQRVQPIEIPASPDFKSKKQIKENYKSLPLLSLQDESQSAEETVVDKSSTSAPCHHQIFLFNKDNNNENKLDDLENNDSPHRTYLNWPINDKKSTNVFSYQYKSKSYEEHNENDFKSLNNFIEESENKHLVPKSYSFRSKLQPPKKDNVPVEKIETKNNNVVLLLKDKDILDKNCDILRKKSNEQCNKSIIQKEKNNSTTFISLNATEQLNSSEIIREISNTSPEKTNLSQAKSKTHLRKSSENLLEPKGVPEFLKIQLNKVSTRTPTNVVLSTIEPTNVVLSTIEPLDNKQIIKTEMKLDNNNDVLESNNGKDIKEKVNDNKQSNLKIEESNRTVEYTSFSVLKTSNITEVTANISDSNEVIKSKHNNKDKKMDKEKTPVKSENEEEPVVLRRKSSGFGKKDKDSDEPELLKVFARRSLKLKDSEAESLSQHVIVLMENSPIDNTDNMNRVNLLKSNDKENEISNESEPIIINAIEKQTNDHLKESLSSNENRSYKVKSVEKQANEQLKESLSLNEMKPTYKASEKQKNDNVKESLSSLEIKSKVEQTSISKKKIEIVNKFEKLSIYDSNQKSISSKEDEITPLKTKSIISKSINKDIDNKKCDSVTINLVNKNQNDVINTSLKNEDSGENEYTSMFKRISQRKEEWEQRAQQALNKKTP